MRVASVKRILLSICGVIAAVVCPLFAADVWFTSTTTAAHNESYEVSGEAYMEYWGEYFYLDIYKPGSGYIHMESNYGYYDLSFLLYQTDSGPKIAEYEAQTYGDLYPSSVWHYVTIASGNAAPFGARDYTSATVTPGGNVIANGWAVDPEMGAPITRVDIMVNGNDVGDATLGGQRPDVATAYSRPDYHYSGWDVSWSTASLSPGTHTFALRAVDNLGAQTTFGSTTFVVLANSAPTISWSTTPPSFPNAGTTFTARATGSDVDGNLSQVVVDQSVNGGAWTALAANGGGGGSSNTSDGNLVTASATEGTTYQFRAIAHDSGSLSSGYIYSGVVTVNRSPTVSIQVLDDSKIAVPIGGNGRAQVLPNSNFYLRIAGSDPDGRLAMLWMRHQPVTGSSVMTEQSVSGSSASYDFGPFNSGVTLGVIDIWAHATDAEAGGYTTGTGLGWGTTDAPDIDVAKGTQSSVSITSGSSFVYGNTYTATAAGGSGSGALSWSLGTGSTASGAAINASTGVVTAASAGTVAIKVRRLGDTTYNDSAWSSDKVITVSGRSITVTIAGSKAYDGSTAATGATAIITSGSLAAGDSFSYSNTNTSSVVAGTYTGVISPTIANSSVPTNRNASYVITYAGNYQINPRAITLALGGGRSYSGTTAAANLTATVTSGALVAGDTLSLSAAVTSNKNAGTYTAVSGIAISATSAPTSRSSSYAITFTGNYKINKHPLDVTALDVGRVYGANNPTFTASMAGWVNGENSSVTTGSVSLTASAVNTSPVGDYTIVAAIGTLASPNYEFIFHNGTLSVTEKELTVKAANKSKTYGAANPSLTTSYSGFANSETTSVLTGAPSLTTAAVRASPVGTYTITISVGTLSATNYSFKPENGVLTINKATPSKTFAAKTRSLGLEYYTVTAADLDATFAHSSPTTGVVAPTGTVTYSLVEDGVPVEVGTQILGGRAVTVRASYPGDGNYNATTVDSMWTLNYVDTDSDGLPDYWEVLHLGDLSSGVSADPFGVGRTLLQSFQQDLSPWPEPKVADGLQTWYRSDLSAAISKDSSDSVSRWLDGSGRGRHMVQSNPAVQPLWLASVNNGKPAVEFGAGEHLKTALTDIYEGSNDFTVIALVLPDSTQPSTDPVLLDHDALGSAGLSVRQFSGGYGARWRNVSDTVWHGHTGALVPIASTSIPSVVSFVKSAGTQSAYLDSAFVAQQTYPVESIKKPFAELSIGGAVGVLTSYFSGKVIEVYIYNRSLTTQERAKVESNLAARYSLSYDPDEDGDGLPDPWEMAKFGHLSYGANDDPDGNGLDNAAELRAESLTASSLILQTPIPLHYQINTSNWSISGASNP
jgi:hypothetical protein